MLRLTKTSSRLRDGDDGFSIIEVIVALMVFSLVAVGVAGGITASLVITRDTRSREVAVNLAAQTIDSARSTTDILALDSTDPALPTPTQTVGGVVYTIKQKVNWVQNDGTTSSCGTNSSTLASKHVAVTVSWAGQSTSSTSVTSDTLVSPSSSINDPTLGTIIVTVLGATGTGNGGIAVSVTPNGSPAKTLVAQPDPTDPNGCAYALKVTPGSYTVALTSVNGIDYTEDTTPTATAVVTAGTNSTTSFQFDTAATFALSFASNYTGPAPKLPSNLTTTFVNAKLPAGLYAASSASTVRAFPFTDGYSVIAGTYAPSTSSPSCVNSDPAAWTTKAADGAVGGIDPVWAPKPGGTANVAVPMGVVQLGGLPINTFVTAVSTSGPPNSGDPGCAAKPTYTFGAITTSGTIALPFGSYALYSGISLGILNLSAPLNNATVLTRGSVAGNVVTLDPRQVPK